MIFSSFEFIFVFLPIVLLGFHWIGRTAGKVAATAWLTASSLVFYSVWRPSQTWIFIASLLFNFCIGSLMERRPNTRWRTSCLVIGLTGNLLLLGWFKYSGFIAENLQRLGFPHVSMKAGPLPLGISFFTFQLIAWLMDLHRRVISRPRFLNFIFFISFFPHHLAGPILHHSEIVPQLEKIRRFWIHSRHFAVGIGIFAIGLAKKVLVADQLAVFANPVFNASEAHGALSTAEAWGGLLAYTGQIYFDFSGYSDMAIGLGRLFGIIIPVNFFSPYKSVSIIEFWRRWHITLSRFLRDYLYIPLGGAKRGRARQMANLLVVMMLGGLWHGAAWNFVLWGLWHGALLAVNHAWRNLKSRKPAAAPSGLGRFSGWALTFACVTFSWLLFRCHSMTSLKTMCLSLLGRTTGFADIEIDWFYIGGALLIAWLAPNTLQLWRKYRPAQGFSDFPTSAPSPRKRKWTLHLNIASAVLVAVLFIAALTRLHRVSPFLYLDF